MRRRNEARMILRSCSLFFVTVSGGWNVLKARDVGDGDDGVAGGDGSGLGTSTFVDDERGGNATPWASRLTP